MNIQNIDQLLEYIKEITNWVPIFRLIGAVTLIISSLLLIPFLGVLGTAYGVVLAFIAMSITIYIKTRSIYPVDYNWLGMMFPLVFLLSIQLGINSLLMKITISIFYPIFWYFIALNKDEKEDLLRMTK